MECALAAAQGATLALARPARNNDRRPSETLSTTRHAVWVEATGPNKPGGSRSAL